METNQIPPNVIMYGVVAIGLFTAFCLKNLILNICFGICDCWCGPGKCECGCGCKAPDCPCWTRNKSDHNDAARHETWY